MVRAYRPYLKALNLTYPQYLVMLVLWELDEVNVRELGARLHLDSGTLTPLLKRLDSKGLVGRYRGTIDERVRIIKCTHEGKRLRSLAKPIPKKVACDIGLSIEELNTLRALCRKLGNSLTSPH